MHYKPRILWRQLADSDRISYRPVPVWQAEAEVLETVGQWERAEQILRKNLEWAWGEKAPRHIADACCQLSHFLRMRSQYSEAMALAQEAEAIYQQENNGSGLFQVYRLMGCIHQGWSDHKKSIAFFEKARTFIEGDEESEKRFELSMSMAIAYYWLADYENVLRILEDSRRLLGDRRYNIRKQAAATHLLGRVYRERQDYQRAQPLLEQALDLFKITGDILSIAMAWGSMAGLYLYQGRYQEALHIYQEQKQIMERLGEKYYLACVHGDISSIYFEIGDLEGARSSAEEEYRIGSQIEDKLTMGDAHFHLALIFEEEDNWQQALAEYRSALVYAEQVQSGLFLPDYLIAEVWCLCALEKTDQAREAVERTRLKAAAFKRTDVELQCRLLDRLLDLEENQAQGVEAILKILQETEGNDSLKAKVYYWLWRKTQGSEYRLRAREAYRRLSADNPRVLYQRRLAELEG